MKLSELIEELQSIENELEEDIDVVFQLAGRPEFLYFHHVDELEHDDDGKVVPVDEVVIWIDPDPGV